MKKNETINFVDYLTKKDIKLVLNLMGYKLIDEQDVEELGVAESMARKPMLKFNEDQEHSILCFCRRMTEEESQKFNIILKNHRLLTLLALSMAITQSLTLSNNSFAAYGDEVKWVRLENFYAYESLLCNDSLEAEIFKACTKVYEKFMTKKFGTFYVKQRKKYIHNLSKKLLNKEEKAQENTKEE